MARAASAVSPRGGSPTVAGDVLGPIVHEQPPALEQGWRTSLAVAALTCQIGVRISRTSAVLTSETGRRPMRGKAF